MRASLRYSAIVSWSAFSIAAMAGGCSDGPPAVRIARVVIDAPRQLDAAAADREAIRAGVQQRIAAERTARLEANERDATHVLHLRISEPPADRAEVEPVRKGRGYLVQVRLRPLASPLSYETFGAGGGHDVVTAVLAAFDDAWGLLQRQRRLDLEKDAALIALLGDPDPRLRDFAIVRLGDRKSKEAVGFLCEVLQREQSPELVLRTIGALVAIGDARAVEPIIELSNRREPEFVLQVVYAVGAIGGRTAEAYLVTMASGHALEAVRKAAEQALAEMQRRSPRP